VRLGENISILICARLFVFFIFEFLINLLCWFYYNSEIGLIGFIDLNKKEKGFELDAGRVTNLKFQKQ